MTTMLELSVPERRAVNLANDLQRRFAYLGLDMTPGAQLSLYHYIKDGQCACPGGECCNDE